MLRRLPVLFCALIFWLLTSHTLAETLWSWSPPAAHHAAVVLVKATDGNSISSGSGCYVRVGQWAGILTAAHCVRGEQISITWHDGTKTAGEPLTDRSGADCAFVQAVHPTLQPLAIAATEPQPGDWLEFAGFGGPEDRLRHWWARLSSSQQTNASYAGAVLQGDSGGPVFDRTGSVVGVIAWGGGDPIRYAGAAAAFAETGGPSYRTVREFTQRVEQRYRGLFIGGMSGGCGPQGCGPGNAPSPSPGGSGWAYPPQQPTPPPMPAPIPAPQPPPMAPIAPQPSEPQPHFSVAVDYDRLARVLLEYCAADGRFRGPVGPKGEQGNPGPPAILSAQEAEALAATLYTAMLADPRFRGPAGEMTDAQIEQIVQRLVADPRLRGPVGPPGPAGPAGKDGAAATAAPIDVDAVAKAVAGKLPPIYFRKVNAATGAELSPPEPVRLGEGFTFLLTPGSK